MGEFRPPPPPAALNVFSSLRGICLRKYLIANELHVKFQKQRRYIIVGLRLSVARAVHWSMHDNSIVQRNGQIACKCGDWILRGRERLRGREFFAPEMGGGGQTDAARTFNEPEQARVRSDQAILDGMAGADDAEVALWELIHRKSAAVRSNVVGGPVELYAILCRLFARGIARPGGRLSSILNFDLGAEIEAVVDCVGFHGENRTPGFVKTTF